MEFCFYPQCSICKKIHRPTYSLSRLQKIAICNYCEQEVVKKDFNKFLHGQCSSSGCFFYCDKISSSSIYSFYITYHNCCSACILDYKRHSQQLQPIHIPKRTINLETSSKSTRHKRISNFIQHLNLQSTEKKKNIYKNIQSITTSGLVTQSDYNSHNLCQLIKRSLDNGIPGNHLLSGYNIDRSQQITESVFYKKLNRQLDLFQNNFQVSLSSNAQFQYAMVSPTLALRAAPLPNYQNYFIIQGDGRNLSTSGQIHKLDNVVIGYRRIFSVSGSSSNELIKYRYDFIPIFISWMSETKTTMYSFLRQLNFEELVLQSVQNLYPNMTTVICSDMKFIWSLLDLPFHRCPWCGVNSIDIRSTSSTSISHQHSAPSGLFIHQSIIIDILHCIIRCSEGIVDMIEQGFFKGLGPFSRTNFWKKFIQPSEITTKGYIRLNDFKMHERNQVLINIESKLSQDFSYSSNPEFSPIIQLISSFNTIIRLIQRDDSDITQINRNIQILENAYFFCLRKFNIQNYNGILYFHSIFKHVSQQYQTFGNLRKFSTEEEEFSHHFDKLRFQRASEKQTTSRTCLKLLTGTYSKKNLFIIE